MLPDILIGIGAIGFFVSDIKQALKIYCNPEYDTRIISRTKWIIKIISVILVLIAYVMLGLDFAVLIALGQLCLSLFVLQKIGLW